MSKFRVAVLVTVLLAFLIVGAALTNRAMAGEVEAEVIQDHIESVLWTPWPDTTPEDWDGFIGEAVEIYDDTNPGTACEGYAGVAVGYMSAVRDALFHWDAMPWQEDVAFALYYELDQHYGLCLTEGS